MDSPGEILHLCRLCLVKDQVNVPIFEEQGDIRQISLKISSCLPVKVSRDDKLPKKICDGCSEKLDICYDFWSSSANAEKTLYSWLGQEEEEPPQPEVPKPIQTLVKEERDLPDKAPEESTKDESEAPPRKRARRTAAVKARVNIPQESEDEDLDTAEPFTKVEDDSEGSDNEEKDPSYTEMPGTSADDDQAGPSGVGKDDVEAPDIWPTPTPKPEEDDSCSDVVTKFYCNKCGVFFKSFGQLHKHMFEIRTGQHRFRCPSCEYIVGRNLVDVILHTKRFCNRDDFRRAEEQMAVDNPDKIRYYCERCCKGVTQLSDLLKHYADHKNQKLQCGFCPKTTTNLIELLIHYRDHTVIGNVMLPCKLCPLEFFASTPYKFHYYSAHSMMMNIPFECNLCPAIYFDDEEEFISHVQGHSITKTPPERPRKDVSKVTCEICAEIFEDTPTCKQHKTTAHKWNPNDKRICPHCNIHVSLSDIPAHLHMHLKKKAEQQPKNTHHRWEKLKSGVDTADSIVAARRKLKIKSVFSKSEIAAELKQKKRKQPNRMKHPVKEKAQPRIVLPGVNKFKWVSPAAKQAAVSKTTEAAKQQPTATSQGTFVATEGLKHSSVAQKAPVKKALNSQQLSLSSFQSQLKCDQCSRSFLSTFAFNEHQKCHMLEKVLEASKKSRVQTHPLEFSSYGSNSPAGGQSRTGRFRIPNVERRKNLNDVYSSTYRDQEYSSHPEEHEQLGDREMHGMQYRNFSRSPDRENRTNLERDEYSSYGLPTRSPNRDCRANLRRNEYISYGGDLNTRANLETVEFSSYGELSRSPVRDSRDDLERADYSTYGELNRSPIRDSCGNLERDDHNSYGLLNRSPNREAYQPQQNRVDTYYKMIYPKEKMPELYSPTLMSDEESYLDNIEYNKDPEGLNSRSRARESYGDWYSRDATTSRRRRSRSRSRSSVARESRRSKTDLDSGRRYY